MKIFSPASVGLFYLKIFQLLKTVTASILIGENTKYKNFSKYNRYLFHF